MLVRTTIPLYDAMSLWEIPEGTEFEASDEHNVTSDYEPRWVLVREDRIIPHARAEWFEVLA